MNTKSGQKSFKNFDLLFLAVCLIVFAYLALTVRFRPEQFDSFDHAISRALQSVEHPWLLQLMIFISAIGYGSGLVYVVLGVFLLFLFTKNNREAIFILLVPLLQPAPFLKAFFQRPRPSSDLVRIDRILHDPGFPSGHVVQFAVIFGFIFVAMMQAQNIPQIFRRGVRGACLFLILTVSISRVYLGAHWTTDVMAGYSVGFILLYLWILAYRKIKWSVHSTEAMR